MNTNEQDMLRVTIVDDHGLVREIIAMFLTESGVAAVTQCNSISELNKHLSSDENPDVILLDYSIPDLNGVPGFGSIVKKAAGSAVVLFSGTARRTVVDELMALGAAGYFPKTLTGRSLLNALKFVASGERFLPAEFYEESDMSEQRINKILISKERDVLRELCKGRSNKEIAYKYDLSLPTTKTIVRSICKKLNADNRTHAAIIAQREGWDA